LVAFRGVLGLAGHAIVGIDERSLPGHKLSGLIEKLYQMTRQRPFESEDNFELTLLTLYQGMR
jgi:hypothetical protein